MRESEEGFLVERQKGALEARRAPRNDDVRLTALGACTNKPRSVRATKKMIGA